jgi:hypothetical protein
LFRESPERRVNAFTIVATEPDSETRLRFAVSGSAPHRQRARD